MIYLHPQMWVMSAGLFPRCNCGGQIMPSERPITHGKWLRREKRPALKGMVHAATVMAMTGVDAITNPELREAAWADLKERVGEEGYVSALPDRCGTPDQGNGGIKRITVFSPRSGPDEGGDARGWPRPW